VRGAAHGVVREADELVVPDRIAAQAADGDPHAATGVPIEPRLRPVVVGEVGQVRRRCARQAKLLRLAGRLLPTLEDLLGGRLLVEAHEDGRQVPIAGGDANALGRDARRGGGHDPPSLGLAPDLERFLLGLLLLALDEGDDVVDHLGPAREGLAGARDRLVGADEDLRRAEDHEGIDGRHVALQRAVGFDGDEAALAAESLALRGDDGGVVGVDLGDHHRHVGGPAMGGVVRHHRDLVAGVVLFELPRVVLGHVHRAEHEVDLLRDRVDGGRVEHLHAGHRLRDRRRHGPAALHRVLVGLARRLGAGGQGGDLEPGVMLEQGEKPLAHHAGRAQHPDAQ